MHEMCVLDRSGDIKTSWNPNVEAEVDVARAQFDALRAKGYAAYRVEPGGDKGELIREFDRYAGRILLAPPMRGG